MESKVTIYQKPTCSTCRKTVEILKDQGIPFESINYMIEPPSLEEMKKIVKKLGVSPREVFRKKESLYKEIGIDDREISDNDLIRILVENPELIERPIVVRGKKAVIARPPEKINELF
jgi:arsenate reductase (glutaredoxin)